MNRPTLLLVASLLAACVTPDDDHQHAAPPPSSSTAEAAPPGKPAAQAEATPAASSAPADGAAKADASASAFPAEPGWVAETPTSAMRKAQFRLPHAEGDTEDASLVVFHFGGQGGSREANLERWTSQFEQPDGRPSSEVVKSSARTVDGREIFDVELAGTYVAETAPGSGQRVRKENWRMLATILDAPSGPYYVKLVGPAATIARWEPAYRHFVTEASARVR